MAWSIPYNLLGIQVSGDLGDMTIYTDRFGRKVWFPKSPPKKPPSQLQIDQRESFKSAQKSWSDLNDSEKRSLEDACRRVSLPLTGQNLWISTKLTGDSTSYTTIERQSGVTLPTI